MKRLLLVSFVAFVSFVIASAGVRAEVIEQILVRVNGEVFTKSDLEARQADALRELGQDVDAKKLGDAQLRAALDKVTPQLMAGVVDEMLLMQRGKGLGYIAQRRAVYERPRQHQKDRKLDTEEQFQQALKDSNMTLADLRRQVEKSVVMDRVRQNEVLSKIAISDEEARRYYDAHKTEFTKAQEITLRDSRRRAGQGWQYNQRRSRQRREGQSRRPPCPGARRGKLRETRRGFLGLAVQVQRGPYWSNQQHRRLAGSAQAL